jgi:hypothetical protein
MACIRVLEPGPHLPLLHRGGAGPACEPRAPPSCPTSSTTRAPTRRTGPRVVVRRPGAGVMGCSGPPRGACSPRRAARAGSAPDPMVLALTARARSGRGRPDVYGAPGWAGNLPGAGPTRSGKDPEAVGRWNEPGPPAAGPDPALEGKGGGEGEACPLLVCESIYNQINNKRIGDRRQGVRELYGAHLAYHSANTVSIDMMMLLRVIPRPLAGGRPTALLLIPPSPPIPARPAQPAGPSRASRRRRLAR